MAAVESLGLDSGQDAELFWTAVVAVAMVLGLIGTIVPVLPGILLIWGAAVVYGLLIGFTTTGWVVVGILSVLAVMSIIKSIVIPRRAAAQSGASIWAQLGAVFGGMVGFFIIPVLGLVIGALAGLLAVEVLIKGNWDEAWTATIGTAKGFGISALIDLGLGLLMIISWSVWAATMVF